MKVPTILDMCCGPRMCWFNHKDPDAVYMDIRKQMVVNDRGPGSVGISPSFIAPDILADFSSLPFHAGSFDLVLFDPPHMKYLESRMNGILAGKYGMLFPGWKKGLELAFSECFRVLRPGGSLVFKWNEIEVPLREVLEISDQKPRFGHRSGKKAKTHWLTFHKARDPLGV